MADERRVMVTGAFGALGSVVASAAAAMLDSTPLALAMRDGVGLAGDDREEQVRWRTSGG